jgi:hypothetical protein
MAEEWTAFSICRCRRSLAAPSESQARLGRDQNRFGDRGIRGELSRNDGGGRRRKARSRFFKSSTKTNESAAAEVMLATFAMAMELSPRMRPPAFRLEHRESVS